MTTITMNQAVYGPNQTVAYAHQEKGASDFLLTFEDAVHNKVTIVMSREQFKAFGLSVQHELQPLVLLEMIDRKKDK